MKARPLEQYPQATPEAGYELMWQRCREDYPRVSRHEFDLACAAALLNMRVKGQALIRLADYWSAMEPLLQNLPSAGGGGERQT